MAQNKIQIKRSSTTATPASLSAGEMAFSNVVGGSGVLYIGSTDGGTVVPIGGVRNPGTLTANQALVANSTSAINQVQVGNVVMVGTTQTLSVNGSTGTAGYILFSGGSGANSYWGSTGGLQTNTAAQYAWTNTQSFSNTISFNGQVNFANAISANGAIGTAGYVLISAGSGANAYWGTIGSVSLNTASQFTWSNTQTFQNTITFSTSILANTVNATSYNTGGGYGSATGGVIANATAIAIGNATVNATVTSNATVVYFTGTAYNANNATNLGGVASGSYQLNSTLGANIASYLPTYTGTVNAAIITDGTYGTTANGFVINSTAMAWGNNSANVYIGWDATAQDLLSIAGNVNNYVEAVIYNTNTGPSASADFSINDNLGPYSNNFIDIGINSTTFSNTLWTINGPSDAYVYTGNTNLGIGTGGNQGNITFFTAGTLAGNERMRITAGGNVGINNTNPQNTLSVNGTTYFGGNVTATGTSNFADVNVSGNLVVSGTVLSVNTVSLIVNDNIIELGSNNGLVSSDVVDIGFFAPSNTAGTLQYSGIARIAASSANTLPWFKIFSTTANPNTATTITSSTTGILQAYLYPYGAGGAFVANGTSVQVTANTSVNVNITANTLTLSTPLAGTSGGTGKATMTNNAILVGNSTNGYNELALGTTGYVLQSNGTALVYDVLDGGTF